MKKRLLAVLMALCITSLETVGAYAAVAENGDTSQIAVEEIEESIEDSSGSEEGNADSLEGQENDAENSDAEGQENAADQNEESSQVGDSSEENTAEPEDEINQQDPNVEEENEQEEELSEVSNEGITDKETAAIEEPKEADNAESSDAVMSGECGAEGDNLTWELSGTETDLTLTIRGSGQMASYSQNTRAPWYENAANIKHIFLSEEMISIGDHAFDRCSSLTSVTIPNSVKSIGSAAFNSCWKLTNITIPEGVTSIGDSAFSQCSRLARVTIPEGVTSIGDSAFYMCSSLTSVMIPEGVTSIGTHAFYECSSLTSVTIPEGVTSIGDSAFSQCSRLARVTIPEGVTSIGDSAFYMCSSLTSVTIPEGVTSIGTYAFYECSSLTSVTILEGVKSIGNGAFCSCSSLTSVMIPEGVTSIGDSAFYMCSSLTSVTIPKEVTSIGKYAFHWCNKLNKVNIGSLESWLKMNVESGNSALYGNIYLNGEPLTNVIIPEGVTSIKNSAFSGCSNLTSVTIPEGVTSIGDFAFSGCSSLKSVAIPEGVTSIGEFAFYCCSNLKNVTIPEGIMRIENSTFNECISLTSIRLPEGLTSIESNAFEGCDILNEVHISSLESWLKMSVEAGNSALNGKIYLNDEPLTKADIPEGVTSIRNSAFSGCSSLMSVIIPEGVTSIESNAFGGCNKLNEVHISSLESWLKMSVEYGNNSLSKYLYLNDEPLTKADIPEGVTSIRNSAFSGCSSLTSVTIPEGVTSIGNSAFSECSKLTSVTIPEGVTSIGGLTFSGCSSLTSVTIPEGVTSIGVCAFSECSRLTSVTIPEGVTSIGGSAFSGCSSLTSVTIPEGVKSIGYRAFSGCSSLTSVTIPEGATSIGDEAFNGCSSLTSVTIPEGATSIGDEAFNGCSSLTSIRFPEGLTSIESNAFGGCNKLNEVHISSLESWLNMSIESGNSTLNGKIYLNDEPLARADIPEGVTSIRNSAFSGCSSLTSVTIPEGVTSIGNSAFSECSKLTSVTIPEGVTSIGGFTFSGCSSLTSVTIPEGVTSIGVCAFSECSSLTNVTIPEGATSIGDEAFNGCSSLTSVTIPEGVTNIGESAFSGCRSLTSVTIPEGVTSIGDSTFTGCSSLMSVTIPEGVTSIGNSAFSYCSSLMSVTIPEGVTSIGGSAFSECSRLTSVTISEGVTSIGDFAFYDCRSLTSVTIPEEVTNIGRYAFEYCDKLNEVHISSLESWLKMSVGVRNDSLSRYLYLNDEPLTNANIPEGVTSIRNYAFSGCSSLTSVTIPEGATSIGDFAFYRCSSLTSVVIPEGVTSIGSNTFKYCWNLASITIPEGVTSIGGSAFYSCNKLKNVCIPYSTENINSEAFSNYSGKVYYWGTGDEWEKIYNGDKEVELISIFLDKDMLNLENNQSTTLFITSNYEDIGNDILWSSSDNEIVSVSETGIVTANNIGEAIITAATRWGDHTASCMVSVVVPVTGILLEQEQVELSSGSSKQLIVVIEPDDATNKEVTWTSSNPEIVSVDEDGIITAHSGGTATITAVTKDGQFSADCTVTVPVPVESVSLDKSEMLLKADEACSLNATVLPEDAAVKELIWTSSDESVVTVDDGGTVTAHRPGSAVITVTTVDGGKTDSCVITVPAPVPVSGVELEHDSITVDIDTEVELKAIVYPEDAANKNLIWSSSDESVASISSNGVLQAKEVGVAEITVRTEDGSYTATCQVSVIIPVNEIVLDKDSIQLEKGQNEKITVEILPENAAETIITWKSSDTKVATVDETGIVTATGGGTAVITASTSNGKTAQCVVEVSFTYSGINYILNGGDNNPENPEQYNELGISEFKEPTRSGYIFKGWYADEQLTEKVTGIEAGQTGDLTIYAKWTGKTYKIVFNGNSADSGKMSKISYTVGKTASLPGNTFKKKEYVFNGWNTKANGKGIGFKNKGSLGSYDAANGSTITLYAQWKLKDYSIVYKLNGGTNNKSNPATYNFKTAVTSLAKPTRKGYTFKGWFTDAKFKNPFKGIKKGSSGNKTVYAKWAAIKYTVSYTLNGGKAPTGNPVSYYVTTNTIKLKNPTKKGYTFGGWYKDSKFKTKIVSIPKGSTGNLKLYAKWTATKYTITYKLNGGTNNKSNPATFTINSANIKFANPTKKGCVFEGWYSDSKFKNKISEIKKGTIGNKTVYARWKVYEYTITYVLNGGRFAIGNPASYNVNTPTITLLDATRSGYTFAGWYRESTFTTRVTTIPKGSAGNLKLYAKWLTPAQYKKEMFRKYVIDNGENCDGGKEIVKTTTFSSFTETVRVIALSDGCIRFVYEHDVAPNNNYGQNYIIIMNYDPSTSGSVPINTVYVYDNNVYYCRGYAVKKGSSFDITDFYVVQEEKEGSQNSRLMVTQMSKLDSSTAFSIWNNLVTERTGISILDIIF